MLKHYIKLFISILISTSFAFGQNKVSSENFKRNEFTRNLNKEAIIVSSQYVDKGSVNKGEKQIKIGTGFFVSYMNHQPVVVTAAHLVGDTLNKIEGMDAIKNNSQRMIYIDSLLDIAVIAFYDGENSPLSKVGMEDKAMNTFEQWSKISTLYRLSQGLGHHEIKAFQDRENYFKQFDSLYLPGRKIPFVFSPSKDEIVNNSIPKWLHDIHFSRFEAGTSGSPVIKYNSEIESRGGKPWYHLDGMVVALSLIHI